MKRLLWLLVVLGLAIGSSVLAQDDETLPLEYTFIDGTTFNYPADFSIYHEEYDSISIANDATDIYIFTLYARSLASNNISNLPEALDVWMGDSVDFEPKDFTPVRAGERSAVSHTYTQVNDSGSEYQRTIYATEISDNGTFAIISVVPLNTAEITEVDRVLAIIGSIRFVDLYLGDSVLGNSVDLPNNLLMEYRDEWAAETQESGVGFSNTQTELRVEVLPLDVLSERGVKDDPIDVLFSAYQPLDESIQFDASQISFPVISGREMTQYRFSDSRNGQRVEHIYLAFQISEGVFVLAEIITTDPLYGDQAAVAEMLLTLREQGDPPPYSLRMDSSYNLPQGITVSFPRNWVVIPEEDGIVTINSVETYIYVRVYGEEETTELNIQESNLVDALLALQSTYDSDLDVSREEVSLITLENGQEAARLQYLVTDDGDTYDRIVIALRMNDGTLVYTTILPQPGISAVTPQMEALSLAILGTMRSR